MIGGYYIVEVNCINCSKLFLVKPYKKLTAKFCSKECEYEYGKLEIKCDYCNKLFSQTRSQFNKNIHNFCSKECRYNWDSEKYLGENNPSYNSVEVQCSWCNKVFKKQFNQFKRSKLHFCCLNCKNNWMNIIYPNTPEGKLHYKTNGINIVSSKNNKLTKPERLTKEFLDNKNIYNIPQHAMYDKFVVDFFIPNLNIIIEVLGDYWHGNPKYYGEEENKKKLSELQIKNKNRDKSRKAYLEKCGHIVYMIWETDIYNDINNSFKFLQ
jgi:G:T-mismatch repair DNA endonuclease (very short patch repair protein)